MRTIDDQKRALRSEVRGRLPAPGSPAHAVASRAAQRRLADSALAARAGVVAVYRALPSECGTALLASELEGSGKTVCYPLIRKERALTFHHAGASFATGTHGIEEPTGEEIPLAAIELLVVPALAVDQSGARLGRGKGYYDATLERFRGVSVALVFDVQIVSAVPHAPHDRRVSAICSEHRLLEVRA